MGLPGLRTHRKFRRLIATLRIPEAHALGHLQMLWETSWDHLEASMGDATDVELAAGWVGHPGDLAAGLVACGGDGRPGFLEVEDGRFVIHDWLEHAPRWVREKLRKRGELAAEGKTISDVKREAGKAGAARRWEGHTPKNGKTMAVCQEEMANAMAKDGKSCPSPPFPVLLKEMEAAIAPSTPEPAKAASRKVDSSPVLMVLPCVGKGPKEWPLTAATLAAWTEAFPGVDAFGEARKMKLWLENTPAKMKTFAGMGRFAIAWLGRQQDRNPSPTTPGAQNGKPSHHRSETDAAGIRQYQERDARRAAAQPQPLALEPDPELQGMF